MRLTIYNFVMHASFVLVAAYIYVFVDVKL